MSALDDRKDAFEKKFAHREEIRFKIEARTSKLLGLWAAEQMGLTGPDAETYAKDVVTANLDEPGYGDIESKVMTDFAEKSVEISQHTIAAELQKFEAVAKQQIMEETDDN